jgi:hypothetical protein
MTSIIMIGALALAAQQTDTTFAVRPNGTAAVEVFQGSVKVGSWDRAQLRVVARHSSRNEVDINTVGSRVEIEIAGRWGIGQAELELTVPRAFGLSIQGVNTPIDVQGVEGDLTLETVNGDVTVRGARGRLQAESVQGLVTIEDSNGRISASSMNRGVRIRNSGGEFHVEAVNGPVLLHGIDARRVDAETVNGAVEYDGTIYADGSYSLASHNGRVAIAIPENAGARVSVYTFNGKLSTSFPIEIGGQQAKVLAPDAPRPPEQPRQPRGVRPPAPPPPPESPHRGRYIFTIGNGGATIELESFGGAIQLVRPGELTRRNPETRER